MFVYLRLRLRDKTLSFLHIIKEMVDGIALYVTHTQHGMHGI